MNNQTLDKIPILPAYKYNWVIKLFSFFIVLSIFYALLLLPKYYVGCKQMHAANIAYKNKNYQKAIDLYEDVLKSYPSSKKAQKRRIELILFKYEKREK